MTSVSSHLQGIMNNPVSQGEKTRRRVSRLETRYGKDAGIAEAEGVVAFDTGGLQYANEAYTFEAPNPIYLKSLVSDFIAGNGQDGFVFENIGAGAFSRGTDDTAGHYGVVNVAQSGANTGSLARPNTGTIANQKIWDGFIFETIFYVPTGATTNSAVEFGFVDSLTTAHSTDGVYCRYIPTTGLVIYIYAAGVNISADTIYSSAPYDTWVKVRMDMQPGGDLYVTVSTRAGSGDISSKIDASDAIGLTALPMIKAFKTTAGSVDLAYFDYVACWSPYVARW